MTVLGRSVEMFRTVVDPMIGNKPKQAFMPKDMNAKAYVTDMGIVVILHTGQTHLVPYGNISSIRLDSKTPPPTNPQSFTGKQAQERAQLKES